MQMRPLYIPKSVFLLMIGISFYGTLNAQNVFEEKGNGHIELNGSTTHFNSVYDNDGQKKPVPTASSTILELNACYGFSKYWNALLHAPVLVQNKAEATAGFSRSASQSYSGTGDCEIGIRFGIPEKNHVRSAINFYEGLGPGKNNRENGLNTGYGDFNQRLTIESTYKKSENWFIQAMVGFNNHNKGFGDEGLAEIKIGGLFYKKVWLIGKCGGVQPLENGDKDKLIRQKDPYKTEGLFYGLYSQDGGQWHYGAELKIQVLKNIGISAGFTGFLKGQYYPHSGIWNCSLYYDLKNKKTE